MEICLVAKGTNVRTVVLERLKELGWSRYQLEVATRGRVPKSSLYRWLQGKQSIPATSVQPILEVLRLEIADSAPETPLPAKPSKLGSPSSASNPTTK